MALEVASSNLVSHPMEHKFQSFKIVMDSPRELTFQVCGACKSTMLYIDDGIWGNQVEIYLSGTKYCTR